jgi:hypothetical protein
MERRSHILLLLGGGTLLGGGAYLAWRRGTKTTDDVKKALEGVTDIATPPAERGKVHVRATGYWPYTALPDERKMEGGTNDRKGKPIITLEQHQADPAKYPYVSVSGDLDIWPYGQRISIDAWPGAVFRVVDTGSHFHGSGKVYRVVGYEPLDIAVQSSQTPVPKLVTATIYPGDNFEKGKAVASSGFKDQTVVGEGRTLDDIEALSRALSSELGSRGAEEQTAAAWALRNRADMLGMTLKQLLAPLGQYGATSASRGYASTRRPATKASADIAIGVLDAPAAHDPTGGATEFWTPCLQEQMHMLGCVHRAAVATGDEDRAQRYQRFAGYATEDDVRQRHARDGLRVTAIVGAVELLGRKT